MDPTMQPHVDRPPEKQHGPHEKPAPSAPDRRWMETAREVLDPREETRRGGLLSVLVPTAATIAVLVLAIAVASLLLAN